MQSSYGGVSEMQQFMVESCGGSTPSLFSNTADDIHSAAAGGSNPLKYQAPPLAAVLPPHFAHFHSIPITQQLFQQPPPAAVHQFQLFHPHHQHQLNYQPLEPRRMQMPHHQQLGLDQDSGPENSTSSARIAMPAGGGGGVLPPSFLAEAMNFKLAVNESSGGGSREGINDEDGILRGGDDDGSESRLHHWAQRDDESSIKELSWRPLDLDIDYINNKNNKSCKNKEPERSINAAGKLSKKSKVDAGAGSSNYKIFSELEAIYKAGGSGGGVNQTGSGSALTGDETPTPLLYTAAMAPPGLPAGADCVGGGMSETSAGEEAGRPGKKFSNNRNSSGRRRRKRRRQQRQLSSVAAFFDSLVKQLMDHQESLHRKFLEAMENREMERTSREEGWRKQEAAKSCREAAARAHEHKLASSREAAIIAFLEKITGESLNLPPKPQFSDENNNNHKSNPQTDPYTEEAAFGDQESNKVQFSTSRWPKTEVQALIRVRSRLESRFQEPGLKGPLWEEVSATMAAMGYLRSAKRCKEKWENINKYFRKSKESGKKRPQHSKTCPYFQLLDQLYSSSSLNKGNIPKEQRLTDLHHDSKEKHDGTEDKLNDNSELLDAIVVPPAAAAAADFPSLKFGFDFNGKVADENFEEGGSVPNLDHNGDGNEEGEEQGGEEVEGDQEREEEEEGEGESQDDQDQEPRTPHHFDQEVDGELHDTTLFFQRLRS